MIIWIEIVFSWQQFWKNQFESTIKWGKWSSSFHKWKNKKDWFSSSILSCLFNQSINMNVSKIAYWLLMQVFMYAFVEIRSQTKFFSIPFVWHSRTFPLYQWTLMGLIYMIIWWMVLWHRSLSATYKGLYL